MFLLEANAAPKFLVAAGIVLALSGCVFSNASSYVDPAGVSGPFHRLIVVASNLPLADTQAAEQIMAAKLAKEGVTVVLGTQVMPPTRLGDKEYVDKAIATSGADGILVVYETDRGTTTGYVPPTVLSPGTATTTGTYSGFGSLYSFGNVTSFSDQGTLNASTTYTPPVVMGGFYVEKPNASYGAVLYDLRAGGRSVWVAEVASRGGAIDSFSNLAQDAAASAVNELKRQGLI